MAEHPPFLNAGNAGPFTLDGTRSYRIGRREAVVLDPGPDVEFHVRALVTWLADADTVHVVVTHGHADHAGCASRLAGALGVPVRGPAGLPGVDEPLTDGERLSTDEGVIRAVDTPGHARRHLSFLWEEPNALFAGDLLLGRGDTTWVGEYPGCVADYLASLERVRALDPHLIYPAHGDPLVDVPGVLARFEAHRRGRIAQVAAVLRDDPGVTLEDLVTAVYGRDLPSAALNAATKSVEAMADYARAAMEP